MYGERCLQLFRKTSLSVGRAHGCRRFRNSQEAGLPQEAVPRVIASYRFLPQPLACAQAVACPFLLSFPFLLSSLLLLNAIDGPRGRFSCLMNPRDSLMFFSSNFIRHSSAECGYLNLGRSGLYILTPVPQALAWKRVVGVMMMMMMIYGRFF